MTLAPITMDLVDQEGAEEALAEALVRWGGTRHMAGQATPGTRGGVDCVSLLAEVLDEVYEAVGLGSVLLDAGPRPRPAQGSGLHNDRGGNAMRKWFRARYPSRSILIASRPLDVVEVRVGIRVNHVGVVGDRGRLWHADVRSGVCWTSLAAVQRRIDVVWRPAAVWGAV